MCRYVQLSASVGVLVMFILGATCEPTMFPSAEIVGENGDAVLYTGPYTPDDDAEPATPLYRMNLDNGQRELLDPSVGRWAESDGDYVAWLDRETGGVRVNALATGEQKQYFADNVLDIDGGRMLTGYADEAGGFLRYFRLIDLATGDERELQLIDPLDLFDDFYSSDLDGDYLAYFASPLDDTEALLLELAVRLEIIDLTTDEHTVVSRGMRVGEGPFIAAGLVVWSELKSNSMKSRVKMYDMAGKQTSTLIKDFDSAGEVAYLVDFDGEYLLAARRGVIEALEWLTFPTGASTLELIPLDGDARIIATDWDSHPDTPFHQARLVDHYVVWADYQTNELVAYDIDTALTTRYDLFPE